MSAHASWQTRKDAVIEARHFVRQNSFGTLTTINHKSHPHSHSPVGQIEYYSDIGDDEASLLMISVDMSSAFKNIHEGSPCSLAIRTGDGPRKSTPLRLAAHHRIIMYGEVESYEPRECEISDFFRHHPDAVAWKPHNGGFHKTAWVRFVPTGLYYIGGFGGEHYIGDLPLLEYQQVEVEPENQPSLLHWLVSWLF